MTQDVLVESVCAGFKDMADGTVRFFFDVEPRHADAGLRLFRVRGTAAVLAALKPGAQPSPEPEKPCAEVSSEPLKGGAIAQWLGMRCIEPEFQQWLAERFPLSWPLGVGLSELTRAADTVRRVLSVGSRREIDNDPAARERFERLIRKPWLEASNRAMDKGAA